MCQLPFFSGVYTYIVTLCVMICVYSFFLRSFCCCCCCFSCWHINIFCIVEQWLCTHARMHRSSLWTWAFELQYTAQMIVATQPIISETHFACQLILMCGGISNGTRLRGLVYVKQHWWLFRWRSLNKWCYNIHLGSPSPSRLMCMVFWCSFLFLSSLVAVETNQ